MDRDFTIGFSRGTSKKWLARFATWMLTHTLRRGAKSDLTHVMDAWKDTPSFRLIHGMEGHGMDHRSVWSFNQTNKILYIFKPIKGQLADDHPKQEGLLDWFLNEFDRSSYAFKAITALVLLRIAQWLGIGDKVHHLIWYWGKKWKGLDGEYCCSVQIKLLQRARYESVSGLNSVKSTTFDLFRALLKDRENFRLAYVHPDLEIEEYRT